MAIIVIVGGPPNSGKSTFCESLVQALKRLGVNAQAIDLDPYAPTLQYIRGEISADERNRLKRREIGNKEIQDAKERLEQASKDYDFVIGDAPGGISDDLKPVYQLASHAVILCREDKQSDIDLWKEFFSGMELRIIAIIISRTSGRECLQDTDPIKGILVGLNRIPVNTPAINSLAYILCRRFNL
ncbi:MAG: ATP/GTP-binding protein [Conexivisphaerales archaeon]